MKNKCKTGVNHCTSLYGDQFLPLTQQVNGETCNDQLTRTTSHLRLHLAKRQSGEPALQTLVDPARSIAIHYDIEIVNIQ